MRRVEQRLASPTPVQPSTATPSPAPSRTAPVKPGPRVAFVVGNADYPDAAALAHPVKDVRALAAELRRAGFATEIAENLTKQALLRAIDDFKKKIEPGSAALFYFGGYGLQANRQTYIIPIDAQIWAEADISRDGISLETIMADLTARGASVKIAIIDAARRNPYERRFRATPAGLAPIIIGADSLIIYSVGVGQVLKEGNGERSLFMGELLKELRAPGISAEEAFNRTRIGVSRASGAEQVPWVTSSLVDSFYFASPPGATTDRATTG